MKSRHTRPRRPLAGGLLDEWNQWMNELCARRNGKSGARSAFHPSRRIYLEDDTVPVPGGV